MRNAGIFILSAVASLSARAQFSVTPYLQHPSTNAMTILFFTTENVGATVKVWRADGQGETNAVETAGTDVSTVLGLNPADSKNDKRASEKQYRHRARFENLRTHTDYRYEVALAGGQTYRNGFRTLPDRNTPVRFIGYCDTETVYPDAATSWSNNGGKSKYLVTRQVGYASNIVHIVSRRPDLITISGDLVAKGGYQKNWDMFWRQNAGEYNDPAGSIPILASYGNHDLKEGGTIDEDGGGENPLKKYLTYFEYNPNGVKYEYGDGTTTKETRDLSQLFHREDLGPVTLIFLDTNKGDNGDCSKSTQDYSKRPAMRAPDFNPGSPQYAWLTNNLADAQKNARFTFVINHHCPYSVGQHNRASNGGGYTSYDTGSGYDGESARAVRVLTETMIRYGVDGWLCGHDEIQEHSQTNGIEVLPDGTTRPHTLNVYDLGSGGDGLRGDELLKNPLEVYRAFEDCKDVWSKDGVLQSGGCHYGHIEVDVTTNRNGKWMCSLTPVYVFVTNDKTGKIPNFTRQCYEDRLIIDEETDEIVWQEAPRARKGTGVPADYVEYVRPPQMADEAVPAVDPEPEDAPEATESLTLGVGETVTLTNHCRTNPRFWFIGKTKQDRVVTAELGVPTEASETPVGYQRRATAATNEVVVTVTGVKPGEEKMSVGRQYKRKEPVHAVQYEITVE